MISPCLAGATVHAGRIKVVLEELENLWTTHYRTGLKNPSHKTRHNTSKMSYSIPRLSCMQQDEVTVNQTR